MKYLILCLILSACTESEIQYGLGTFIMTPEERCNEAKVQLSRIPSPTTEETALAAGACAAAMRWP